MVFKELNFQQFLLLGGCGCLARKLIYISFYLRKVVAGHERTDFVQFLL